MAQFAVGPFPFIPVFRLPRFLKNLLSCFFPLLPRLAGEFRIGEALAHAFANQITEAVRASQRQAIIITKRLFIDIPEQVERLYAHVGAVQSALQQTPEILDTVGVDIAIHVRFHVVDYVMGEIGLKPEVRLQFVGENVGTRFNVLVDVGYQRTALRIADDGSLDLAAALENPLYPDLADYTAALAAKHALTAVLVHIPRLAADEIGRA